MLLQFPSTGSLETFIFSPVSTKATEAIVKRPFDGTLSQMGVLSIFPSQRINE
jgi:hypothetical protein